MKRSKFYIIASLIFLAIAVALFLLPTELSYIVRDMPLWATTLVAIFAVFRLIRLVTYDKVTNFIRHWFRKGHFESFRYGVHELLSCPWCSGMWISLVFVPFVYHSDFIRFFAVIFAISGVATLIQLLANTIGWRAEYTKRKVEKFEKK